jgi:hypothetical protein
MASIGNLSAQKTCTSNEHNLYRRKGGSGGKDFHSPGCGEDCQTTGEQEGEHHDGTHPHKQAV